MSPGSRRPDSWENVRCIAGGGGGGSRMSLLSESGGGGGGGEGREWIWVMRGSGKRREVRGWEGSLALQITSTVHIINNQSRARRRGGSTPSSLITITLQ